MSAFTVKTPVNTLKVPVASFTAIGATGYMITAPPTPPLASVAGWSATAPTSYSFTTAGSKVLYAWVKDAVGRISPPLSVAVNIDMTAPAITAFTLKTPVNSLAVPVTAFTASDATGVAGYLITTTSTAPLATATTWSVTAPTSVAVGTAGLKTLYAWVKDGAGNVSAMKSATVNVDLTAPVVATFSVKSPVTTLAVPVTAFSASDAHGVAGYKITETSTPPLGTATGWSAAAPTSYTFASRGTKTLYGWAKDAAGNVSLARTVTAVIN